jgi:hypothetical protein
MAASTAPHRTTPHHPSPHTTHQSFRLLYTLELVYSAITNETPISLLNIMHKEDRPKGFGMVACVWRALHIQTQ